MSKVDWSKAPEWAEAHGVAGSIGERKVWFNEKAYMYVGDSRSYPWSRYPSDSNHCRDSVTDIELRPVAWIGEGQPPVGTVCEVKGCMSHYPQWNKVTVFAVRDKTVFFDMEDGRWGQTDSHEFRPISTPEQIAAEEREKARDEVLNAMTASGRLNDNEEQWEHRLKVVGEMLDMGYRKKVTP